MSRDNLKQIMANQYNILMFGFLLHYSLQQASLITSINVQPIITEIPCGLVVRIPGFHPGGPGSIPGMGTF